MGKKVQFCVGIIIILGSIIVSRPFQMPAATVVNSSNVTDEEAISGPLGFDVGEGVLVDKTSEQDDTATSKHDSLKAIREVSESFLRNCFSTNSALEDSDLIDYNSPRFLEHVKNRQFLIDLRREAFSYSKTIVSFALQINDVVIRDDCAIVLGVATENYSYSDSPNHHAGSTVAYLVILSNTDSGWRIYWATSNDAYSMILEEKSNYSTVKGLTIPFGTGGDGYSDLHHAKDYSTDAIFQNCTDFAYKNFAMVREYELENIARELGEP